MNTLLLVLASCCTSADQDARAALALAAASQSRSARSEAPLVPLHWHRAPGGQQGLWMGSEQIGVWDGARYWPLRNGRWGAASTTPPIAPPAEPSLSRRRDISTLEHPQSVEVIRSTGQRELHRWEGGTRFVTPYCPPGMK